MFASFRRRGVRRLSVGLLSIVAVGFAPLESRASMMPAPAATAAWKSAGSGAGLALPGAKAVPSVSWFAPAGHRGLTSLLGRTDTSEASDLSQVDVDKLIKQRMQEATDVGAGGSLWVATQSGFDVAAPSAEQRRLANRSLEYSSQAGDLMAAAHSDADLLPVPEPASLILTAVALVVLLYRRRTGETDGAWEPRGEGLGAVRVDESTP